MKKKKAAVRIAAWILKMMIPESDRETFLADVDEVYLNIHRDKGGFFADFWYFSQLLRTLPDFLKNSFIDSYIMLINYLKIAFRHLKRHKSYSIINIAGLAIGLTGFIIIMLWVFDELNYDKFHDKYENIYRINSIEHQVDRVYHTPETPPALAAVLREQLPEVINSVRVIGDWSGWQVSYSDKYFTNDRLLCTEPSFFDIFNFPFVKGNPETALMNTFSIVITEKTAAKYFGNKDPMGKVINIYSRGYEVTGVIRDIPDKSHLKFDCIIPLTYWRDVRRADLRDWNEIFGNTFILVRDDVDEKTLLRKISSIININLPERKVVPLLQPLKKIYLYSDFSHEFWGMGTKITYVYIFSLTALCVLLIACINFMNLVTARSGKRAKEIGVRKVNGAQRRDIIKQFFTESILLSLIALIFAVAFSYYLLPTFNTLSGKQLSLGADPQLIFGLIGIAVITGLLSGSYPAVFLSRFKPVNILKGVNLRGGRLGSGIRKVLTVTQFSFTVILIILTSVMYNQLSYIRNIDMGYDKENLVLFDTEGEFGSNYEAAKNELLQNPNILRVTRSRWPLMGGYGTENITWEGKGPEQNISMLYVGVDYDYLNTYKIELAEGRFLSEDFSTDTLNYLINETAVAAMGIKDPVGKEFSYRDNKGIIIGVVKDFIHQSIRHRIEPQFYRYTINRTFFCVKIRPGFFREGMDYLEQEWKKFAPGTAFKYSVLSDHMLRFYRADERNGTVIRYFAFFSILISCLGLFGLILYTAEQRTKEIGIRKVLGLSAKGAMLLLIKEFAKWIALANIIAWPVAYYIGNQWLQDFAFRADQDLWIFIQAGLLTFLVALLTVSYQTIRSAAANPFDSLRYE